METRREDSDGSEPPTHARRRRAAAPEDNEPRRALRSASVRSVPIVHRYRQAALLDQPQLRPHEMRGLIHLAVILLVVSNLRVVLSNMLKFGLIAFSGEWLWFFTDPTCLTCLFFLSVFIVLSYTIEWAKVKGVRGELWMFWAHFLVCVASFLVPIVVVYLARPNPVAALGLLMLSMVLTMKLVSYSVVNWRMRHRPELFENTMVEGGTGVKYPQSVTFKNLVYFVCLPTLIYQNEWPRVRQRNWDRIWTSLLQLAFVLVAMRFIMEQYMIPYVTTSLVPLDEMSLILIVDRMTRLAIPNTYLWLLGFYALFHLWFQILAELTMFGDRRFYGDWWNSTTLAEYWSLWNLPVHNFLVEYIYKPARMAGFSKNLAAFLVFTVSGLGHEILVSVPLRTFKFWTLVAFWIQIPLMYVSERYLKGSVLGNIFFWVTFPVVGQIAILNFYVHDILRHANT